MKETERKSLGEGFEGLEIGSHVCSIYSSKEEQLAQVESFIEIGLQENEKIIYIYDERTKDEIIKKLKESDIDIKRFRNSNQFEFMTDRTSYLKNGYFKPKKMFELLSKAKEEALSDGYNSLRGIGEMTWFFKRNHNVEKLMDYESKLTDFLEGKKITVLCQYNENKFSAENLIDVIHTHPKVAINNSLLENHYYMPAEIFSSRIKGEIDKNYYEKVKENLIEKPYDEKIDESSETPERSLQSLLQTLDKIEDTSG